MKHTYTHMEHIYTCMHTYMKHIHMRTYIYRTHIRIHSYIQIYIEHIHIHAGKISIHIKKNLKKEKQNNFSCL